MATTDEFKTCACCETNWKTRDAFLADPEIEVIGYQTNFVALDKGLFLFNHTCSATMAIPTAIFADLYDGPIYQERKTGGEDCPGHCLYENNLRPCPAKCDCAYVREILQLLRNKN